MTNFINSTKLQDMGKTEEYQKISSSQSGSSIFIALYSKENIFCAGSMRQILYLKFIFCVNFC